MVEMTLQDEFLRGECTSRGQLRKQLYKKNKNIRREPKNKSDN